MESIYKQMNNIDDKESLNERYNVKIVEDVDSHITEEQVLAALKKWKATMEYGKLVIKNGAVRYTSEEVDFREYAKISELVEEVNNNNVTTEELEEEPYLLLDYFTEHCGVHHAFELPEFHEKTRKLDIKYFGEPLGTSKSFDGSWMKPGTIFKRLDKPTWTYKFITGPNQSDKNYVPQNEWDYVWYVRATPATKGEFTAQPCACQAKQFAALYRKGLIEITNS